MELESRIDHLERQNRWMKAAILAVAIVAVVMGQFSNVNQLKNLRKVLGESLGGEVRSQQFVLVDEQGHPKGVWMTNKGKCILSFIDGEKKPLVALAAGGTDREFHLYGPGGRPEVSLLLDEHAGSLLIRSTDSDSNATALLNVGATGPRLSMKDAQGNEKPVVPW